MIDNFDQPELVDTFLQNKVERKVFLKFNYLQSLEQNNQTNFKYMETISYFVES